MSIDALLQAAEFLDRRERGKEGLPFCSESNLDIFPAQVSQL
jgi:hypothetical protein